MAAIRSLAAALALISALSACRSGADEGREALERDPAAAKATTMDFAPRSARHVEVVSAEELGITPKRPAAARVAAPRRWTVPRRRQPQPRDVAAQPVAVEAPVSTASERVVAAAAGAPEPATPELVVSGPLRGPVERTPEPPGGYRSVSDVIRNAPFPINP